MLRPEVGWRFPIAGGTGCRREPELTPWVIIAAQALPVPPCGQRLLCTAWLTWRHWHDGTAFDETTSRAFGVVVGIEFGAAALGSLLLVLRARRDLIPVWIAFVVGVHLFPVAALIGYPMIYVVATLITVAALAAFPIARARKLTVSAVVGAPVGLVLLAAALFSAIAAAVTGS